MSLAIVAGAGPGLGQALLRRFTLGGYTSVGLVRSPNERIDHGIRAVDLSDNDAVNAEIGALIGTYGPPKVVVHSPAQLFIGALADTDPAHFEHCWRSMVLSAFNLAKAVMEPMVAAGGGAFLVSGATASLRGGARFSAFASAKFALRGLTQSLAREFQPQGIHVAHVFLDGIVDSERSRALHAMEPNRMMSPDDIVEVYWQIAHQPPSTWSHEIDLRPQSEAF